MSITETSEPFDNPIYFKYSDGESYSLDGIDYRGFINNTDGTVYTGTFKTSDSFELSAKKTFLAAIYENKKELDLSLNQDTPTLTNLIPNKLKILKKIDFDTIFDKLNSNNLNIYKNLISLCPTVYNSDVSDVKFFGLSAYETTPHSFKSDYLHIDPFNTNESLRYLNRIDWATIFVDSDENFKYFINCRDDFYVLSGNFVSGNTITPISYTNLYPTNDSIPDKIHNIQKDPETNRMYIVKNDYIEIYNTDNYDKCQDLVLIDKISLEKTTTIKHTWSTFRKQYINSDIRYKQRPYITYNPNNPTSIKLGSDYRTEITNGSLKLYSKYSKNLLKSYNLSSYGVEEYVDMDIRAIDDCVLVLHRYNDLMYVMFINPATDYINNKQLFLFDSDLINYSIKFSEFDSNVFTVCNSKQLHTRYISFPTIPIGKLEYCDLYYVDRFVWSIPFRFKPLTYGNFKFKWTSLIKPANILNIKKATETAKNGKMYMILQNIDRIYFLNETIPQHYKNLIPYNIYKSYNGIEFTESSIGLYINSYLIAIITDILNIYNNCRGYFTVQNREIVTGLFDEIELSFNDMILNTNEDINMFTLKRVISKIEEIQKYLAPELNIDLICGTVE